MARHVYLGTAPLLPWFTVLCALVSLVVIRIVVVTAASYGLSQYALEMVVRVLVLELIPLTAALFVALRCTLPAGAELATLRRRGRLGTPARAQGVDPLAEVLPRVLAGPVCVLTAGGAELRGHRWCWPTCRSHGFTMGGFDATPAPWGRCSARR
jgi:phospholipid/cholesterol/gamma-HCH transport system permease protein